MKYILLLFLLCAIVVAQNLEIEDSYPEFNNRYQLMATGASLSSSSSSSTGHSNKTSGSSSNLDMNPSSILQGLIFVIISVVFALFN